MFYKALKKKNKADEQTKEHVDTIVAVHNTMNEETWKQILQYEALYYEKEFEEIERKIAIVKEVVEDGLFTLPLSVEDVIENVKRDCAPRLISFLGKPTAKSPKSLFQRYIMGNKGHFDRHDWVVQRRLFIYTNVVFTSEQRYVIDYYYDDKKGISDEKPKHLHDARAVKSIKIDARPAVDSFESAWHRIKYFFMKKTDSLPDYSLLQIKPVVETPTKEQVEEKRQTLTVEEFKKQGSQIKESCKEKFKALDECVSELDCSQKSLELMFCMANVVCKRTAIELQQSNEADFEEKLENVEKCLSNYETVVSTLK